MKHLPFFCCLLLLFTSAKSQFSYIRKMPFGKSPTCTLLRDSTIGLRMDNQYNTGKQINCYEYYSYDASGRITSLTSNCERGNYQYFYNSQNRTPFADSVVFSYGSIMRMYAYEYDEDSVISQQRWYYMNLNVPQLGNNIHYTKKKQGNKLILTGRDMLFDTTLGYNRITFENGIAKLQETKSTSIQENYITYRLTIETQNSDTALRFVFDSTVSKINSQDLRVSQDSTVTIRSHYNGFDILTTTSKSNGIVYGNPQIFQNWKSIDTIYSNGSSIRYSVSTEGELLSPSSKVVVRKGGNEKVSYKYLEKKWIPTNKEERYFIDADRNCEGLYLYYIWLDNQWVLDIRSTHYYQGQTANRPKPESLPCKIANPFAATYPISCDALLPEEKYVLTVLDLDGHSVLEQEFKADQQIIGLDVLKKDRLYFFTIHADSGKVITRQKIFISY